VKGPPTGQKHGDGVSTTKRTETHTLQYGQRWYRSQDDIERIKERNRLLSRAQRAGYKTVEAYLATNPDTSRRERKTSKVYLPTHTIKGEGVWWRNLDDLEEYRKHQRLIKRAKHAGYDYTQLDEFEAMEGNVYRAVELSKRRDRRNYNELKRLKAKHGLASHANRIHLKAAYEKTKDPEIAAFLGILASEDTTNEKKIAEIRKLFMSGINPYDILYQTALIVGINLRKKA